MSELDTARRLVTRAERRALETAERLRRQAEEVLSLAGERVIEAQEKAERAVAEEVEAAKRDADEARRRAEGAEGALVNAQTQLARAHGQLENLAARVAGERASEEETQQSREGEGLNGPGLEKMDNSNAEGVADGSSVMPGTQPAAMGGVEEITKSLSDLLARVSEDSRLLTEAASKEGERLRSEAEAEAAGARREADEVLASARAEAERIRASAHEDAESDRNGARLAREQAERERDGASADRQEAQRLLEDARDQSTRMVTDVQEECNRLMEAARAAADAEFGGLRREFETHVVALRDALGVARDTLDRFIQTGGTAGSAD